MSECPDCAVNAAIGDGPCSRHRGKEGMTGLPDSNPSNRPKGITVDCGEGKHDLCIGWGWHHYLFPQLNDGERFECGCRCHGVADSNPRKRPEVILIGRAPDPRSEAADLLLDGVTMALQEFDTETLLAVADYRDEIEADGWMQRMIRGYVEVWR